MVEAYHQRGDIHPVSNSLVVSPCFAQRMRAVFALEFNGLALDLDQVVDAGNLQRLPILLALKQVFPWVAGLLIVLTSIYRPLQSSLFELRPDTSLESQPPAHRE